MKTCIHLTKAGKICSRSVHYKDRCIQHYKLHFSQYATEETREIKFQELIDTKNDYTHLEYIPYFSNLTIEYYRQKYIDIVVNYKFMFNENIISDLNNANSPEIMFNTVRDDISSWIRELKKTKGITKDTDLDLFTNIKYKQCVLQILKISIYYCIQENKFSIFRVIPLYNNLKGSLIRNKELWREENINKLRIKEVSKSGVMCDDVFKYVFAGYI